MNGMLTAIEINGTIDEQRQLTLDEPLPVTGPRRVRVIVLYTDDEEWDETNWLRFAATSLAYGFLKDEGEDIYTLTDGEPFRDEA
jgi:hypothetical protein